jgi:hypothetical protein
MPVGRNPISLGEKSGTLTVVERLPIPGGKIYYDLRCVCDCGFELIIPSGKFRHLSRCPKCTERPLITRRSPIQVGDTVGTRIILARIGGLGTKHPRYLVRCRCGAEQNLSYGGMNSKGCTSCNNYKKPIKYASGHTVGNGLFRS